ncbi:hypothetical protein [Geothrix sp. 21YS21S-2]|uniref:hypothetical protein n=1 Tax=Geothrix sp. 21YS21S-2 TaxID=3068893 RepID=UPI0027B907D1|nr:hypothetical protein [Geothrix sp. 21YS21S-2]
MTPLSKALTCSGAILLAAGSAPLRSQAWAAPTATQTSTPTHALRQDGKDSILIGHTWSNWTWVDPEGTRHVFPGTSSANRRMIAINGVGMIPQAGGALEYTNLNLVQALDGAPIYLSTENGGKGKIVIRSQAFPK